MGNTLSRYAEDYDEHGCLINTAASTPRTFAQRAKLAAVVFAAAIVAYYAMTTLLKPLLNRLF